MAELDQFIGKKYKLTQSDSKNFDEYMKHIGVGLISRKTAAAMSPVAELSKDENGNYVLTFTTLIRTVTMVFKLNKEFIEERPDGTKVKSLFTWEDGKLVQIQTEDNGRKSKHVRIFTNETLTAISTADGWDGQCVRVYEHQS